MRNLILLCCWISFGGLIFAQTLESFNFSGALNANGWSTHSGAIPGQFQADNAGSLTFPNLAASTGNKANYVSGNTEDVNFSLSLTSDSAFYSLLLNVPATTGLQPNTNTTGENFFGFGQQFGAAVTIFAGQIRIKQGTVPNTFQLALVNSGAASLVPAVFSQDLQIGTTYFLVVRVIRTTSPMQATLWINPSPGLSNPPASSQFSTQGMGTLSGFGSVYARQNGNATTGTGNLQIDEIRVGTTWVSVTPCSSTSTYYADVDGDSFGNINATIQACSPPIGFVTDATDCNDNNVAINPNTVWYADVDGDSYGNTTTTFTGCTPPAGYVLNSADCDDASSSLNVLLTYYQDTDQDGYGNVAASLSNCGQPTGYVQDSTDCDDSNASINPGITEIADNIDNDCDGLTDEGFSPLTWFLDGDQDGFGGSTSIQSILSPGANYVLVGGDCDDQQVLIYPGAPELCDGLDNNCDGQFDNGLTFLSYYADNDGDTYGDSSVMISACSQPTGYVLNNTDCDDNNSGINPGATDIPVNGIDEDCNGQDAPLVPVNLGMYQFTGTIDCATQDTAVTTQPTGATFSLFSSVGTNCSAAGGVFNRSGWNTAVSVNLNQFNEFSLTADDCKKLNLDRLAFKFRPSGSAGSPIWHLRSSLDNFAADLDSGTGANVNSAYISDTVILLNHTNLDQVTFRFYLTEILGTTTTWRMDDVSLLGNIITVTPQTYYADNDGDGFGDFAFDTLTCTQPLNYTTDNTDCNDQDSLINPNTIWYFDADNDLIGDTAAVFVGCIPPTGYVLASGDCDNANPQITGPVTYYSDLDGDSFGVDSTALVLCQNPGVGYVTVGGDCDDANPSINPNATEICDGIDNDCDGFTDNGLVFTMYYVDADGDGYGDEATGVESCSQPQNTITIGGDCDDTNDQIYPGAPEICDTEDNDCDGSIDEGLNLVTYYTDADNDGFGTGATGISLCEVPGPGFSTNNQDCDDGNNQINPNGTEILDNGIDENCDGVDGILGISENGSFASTLFPNPTSGNSTLSFSSKQNGELFLRDLNGKLIYSFSFNQQDVEILTSELISGTYFLEISINGGNYFSKLMKY
jgi:hypothetical protein